MRILIVRHSEDSSHSIIQLIHDLRRDAPKANLTLLSSNPDDDEWIGLLVEEGLIENFESYQALRQQIKN